MAASHSLEKHRFSAAPAPQRTAHITPAIASGFVNSRDMGGGSLRRLLIGVAAAALLVENAAAVCSFYQEDAVKIVVRAEALTE